MKLCSDMEFPDVNLNIGRENFYLNPFTLKSVLGDLNKRSEREWCPCQGYLQVKVHPAVFKDISDLYRLLTQVQIEIVSDSVLGEMVVMICFLLYVLSFIPLWMFDFSDLFGFLTLSAP